MATATTARATVTARVLTVARQVAGAADVADTNNFYTDLKFDSLDFLDFILDVEDDLNVCIPDERLPDIKTPADLVDMVMSGRYRDKKSAAT